jgi:hypothetical protein
VLPPVRESAEGEGERERDADAEREGDRDGERDDERDMDGERERDCETDGDWDRAPVLLEDLPPRRFFVFFVRVRVDVVKFNGNVIVMGL